MTWFYWHVHHDTLCEPAIEPIKNRIAYIKRTKPAHEIETRLRLLKPVKGKLPEAYAKAEDVDPLAKYGVAYYKVRETYAKARETYAKAWEACKPKIEALHKIECPGCPWDGTSIFPRQKGEKK